MTIERTTRSATTATSTPILIPPCQKATPRLIKGREGHRPPPDTALETALWRVFCGDGAEAPRDTIATELWHDLLRAAGGLRAEHAGQLRAIASESGHATQKNAGNAVAALLKLACVDAEWRPLYYVACKICALAVQRRNNRESGGPLATEPDGAAKTDPRKPRAGQPAKYERLEDVLELAG